MSPLLPMEEWANQVIIFADYWTISQKDTDGVPLLLVDSIGSKSSLFTEYTVNTYAHMQC